MKLSEVARKAIALSETIRDYWDTELPKRHPRYPFVNEGEDSGPPPPEEAELERLLASVPEDYIYSLKLIHELGTRFIGVDDIPAKYEELREYDREWVERGLLRTGTIADYLPDGLAKLKRHGIDIDQVSLLPITSGS